MEASTPKPRPSPAEARAAIAERTLWYHTLEVAQGVETPGWFDLRPIVDRMPWPDVRGKRCLEVGPWDGFLSFELERRGAAEVIAADISHPYQWDWPVLERERGAAFMEQIAGSDPGGGFKIARELLGSSVERIECSVYDLSPERVGQFDIVVCGSLMLHLRDPTRALEAIRAVCRATFLSAETISSTLTLAGCRRPLARYLGGERGQWWIPNVAAHAAMLTAAGFEVRQSSRPYCIPTGSGHPEGHGGLRERLLDRVLTGGNGVPHVAVLAVPRR